MRLWIIAAIAIFTASSLFTAALAQAEIIESEIDYRFGEYISFRSLVQADSPINHVQMFIQREGSYDTISSGELIPEAGVVEYEINPNQEKIRAFSTAQYWYEITLENGDIIATPQQTFLYEDNRFTWATRLKLPFEIYWHEGDTAFGQNILDIAQQSLEYINSLLPVPSPEKVGVYAYANAVDMRDTLLVTDRSWVGAHTDPDLQVMVISLPPGPEQRLEMERQIPHELMHILLYQKIGPSYVNLPAWLNEGLASIAELYPNPDYLILLNSAYEKGNLLPIAALCTTFPRDAAGAYLAYAQAASFTRFLHQEFGSSGLEALLLAYADGLDCERGIQIALGSDLTQLEMRWRQDAFGQDPVETAFTNLAPWIAILLAVLAVPTLILITSLRRRPEQENRASSQGTRPA